ncbi:MAG: hypothetical protein R3E79_04330 [Caldilineaceae bacterium]
MTTRVALIGAGQRAVGHLAALTHIPDVQVVALADLDSDRAEAAQQRANDRRASIARPLPPLSTPTTGACWTRLPPTVSTSACPPLPTARLTTT